MFYCFVPIISTIIHLLFIIFHHTSLQTIIIKPLFYMQTRFMACNINISVYKIIQILSALFLAIYRSAKHCNSLSPLSLSHVIHWSPAHNNTVLLLCLLPLSSSHWCFSNATPLWSFTRYFSNYNGFGHNAFLSKEAAYYGEN